MNGREFGRDERVYFLDSLRFWLVAVVVAFHGALSQTTFIPTWVISDPRQLRIADWLVYIPYNFQMALLFFIAGYFALPSLRGKGGVSFVRRKVWRLLVPAALVLVFLNPVHRYLFHYSRDFALDVPRMSFLEYWPEFFRHVVWFEVGDILNYELSLMHLWFVTLLFIFFVATAMCVALFPRVARQNRRPPSSSQMAKVLVLSSLSSIVAIACLLPWFYSYRWITVGSLILFEVPIVGMYVSYYAMGIVAFRQNWFARPRAMGSVWPWFVACVALNVVTLRLDEFSTAHGVLIANYSFMLCSWSVRVLCCMTCLGFALACAERFWSQRSTLQQHFASISYRVYLTHMVVVVLVQFAFLRMTALSPYVTFVGTLVLSLLLSYVVAAALGRPVRWTNDFIAWLRQTVMPLPGELEPEYVTRD